MSLASYSLVLCLACFGIFFYSNELFCWNFGYLVSFELKLNQILQFIFKLDSNWLFIFFLCLYFLYAYNLVVPFYLVYIFIFLFFAWHDVYTQNYLVALDIFRVNEKLLNGWFMIHPLLTYFFYSVLLSVFILYTIYFIFLNNNDLYFLILKIYSYFFVFRLILCKYVYVGLLALILGGWWAQQELSWNGWWGWDFVEIANLSIFVSYLSFCHLGFFFVSSFFFRKCLNSLLFLLVVYAVSLRYNVFNSLHTFIGLGTTLQLYLYVYILFFIFLGCYFLYNLKYSSFFILASAVNRQFVYSSLPRGVLNAVNVCVCFIVVFSFFLYDYFYYLRDIFFFNLFGFFACVCKVTFSYITCLFSLFNISFFAIVLLGSVLNVLLHIEYKFTKFLHIFVYFYFIIFIFCNPDVDYFLWDYDYCVNYIFNIKQAVVYSFFDFYDSVSGSYSNYITNSAFFNEAFNSFFFENKVLFKSSLYVANNSYVKNSVFFEFFEFKLFFSFITKMYNILFILFFAFFSYFKRKESLAII